MNKNIESLTEQVEIETTLSPSTFSEEVEGGGDTDEGPKNDSDYYDDEHYDEEPNEIELSDSSEESGLRDDYIDETKGTKLEPLSTPRAMNLSYLSTSSGDEEIIENFDNNLRFLRLDEDMDFKDSDFDDSSNYGLKGVSREEYHSVTGEYCLADEESTKVKESKHQKLHISSSQKQQKDKDLDNEQLIQQELLQEEQIQGEQEQKPNQSRQEQIGQEKERQRKKSLKEQRLREEDLKEKELKENEERMKYEKERQLQFENEKKSKEQLRQEQKREYQRLSQEEQLQREEQSHIKRGSQFQRQNLLQQRSSPLQSQPLQYGPNSSQTQRSNYENIFKPGIKSQNEQTTLTMPSLSTKSFHLPDFSLSQQGDVREFRRMSNIFGNNDKGPVAALRTLTDNYKQLEFDKRNADIKVDQLEKQLEQYRQLLRKEQYNSKANKDNEAETITYGIENDTKKSGPQGKFTLTEKESFLYCLIYRDRSFCGLSTEKV